MLYNSIIYMSNKSLPYHTMIPYPLILSVDILHCTLVIIIIAAVTREK